MANAHFISSEFTKLSQEQRLCEYQAMSRRVAEMYRTSVCPAATLRAEKEAEALAAEGHHAEAARMRKELAESQRRYDKDLAVREALALLAGVYDVAVTSHDIRRCPFKFCGERLAMVERAFRAREAELQLYSARPACTAARIP
jgi:hypothetical protein